MSNEEVNVQDVCNLQTFFVKYVLCRREGMSAGAESD